MGSAGVAQAAAMVGKGPMWLWRFCPLLPVPLVVQDLPYPLLLCTNKAIEVFAWDVLG